jgi:hypothetical protein
VVFGDWILWGQGLKDDHKIASLVRAQPRAVDLILLDAGINDVNVQNIVLP